MGYKLKISVIIPTWNRASTIEKAVKSALNQTYPVYEILVCDDGSTDNTREIVSSMGDSRIKWIGGERTGKPAVPRNRGIKSAKGDWLAFLDSDDYWHPEKIEKQLKTALNKKAFAVCSNADRIKDRQEHLGKLIEWNKPILTFDDLMKGNYIVCSSVLLHRSLIEKCDGFPEEEKLKAIEDYALWLRVAAQTNFLYLDEELLNYTDDPKTSIRKLGENFFEQKRRVLSNLLSQQKKYKIPLRFKLKARVELFKLNRQNIPKSNLLETKVRNDTEKIKTINNEIINNPKISVLMSVYNGERYLKEAMESILNQTFTDFEFLIVNDGSTDKSEEIIKSYKDPRIRLINNKKNKGLIFSLNKGLKMAKGRYIARIDSDDISFLQRLERQYEFLEKNLDIALVGAWAELIDENGYKIGEKKELPLEYYLIKFYLFYNNPLMHSSTFFRKKIIEEMGDYDEKYKHAEDYELYTRIVKRYKVVNLPETLIKFRIHSKSIGQTSETRKTQEETCRKIIFNYINYYCKLKWNDFEILYDTLINKHLKPRNILKILLINKKIYGSFIKKAGLDKKELKKIQTLRNELLIKYLVKYIKKVPILYGLAKFFYFVFFKKRIILNYLFLRYKKDIKLQLGSGNKRIKDYINVDSELLPNVDLVCNIKNLKYLFRRNSVSCIYASHIFEHFSHEEVKKVLKLCYDLLCHQGELRLSVPDIDKIVKIYYKNWEHFQTPGNSPWIGLIWGGQLTKYDYHKTGFNFYWMKYLLEQTGFESIKEYDAKSFFKGSESDASLDEAFGEPVSLNIVAKK